MQLNSQNIKTHALNDKHENTQQLYNPFFYTVLNSSRTRTLFFVLEFLDIFPNEKMHNHPRKTRSAMHGCCGWRDLVKNLGDYEFGHRKPQGGPAHLHNRINYNIPYLPIPTKTQKSKNLAKNLTRCSKKHCRPPENSVYRLRKTNIPFYEQVVPHKVYLS